MRLIDSTDVRRAVSGGDAQERAPARLVRCACTVCGTHTNALQTVGVAGSCTNCGSFDLELLEGAAPLDGPRTA